MLEEVQQNHQWQHGSGWKQLCRELQRSDQTERAGVGGKEGRPAAPPCIRLWFLSRTAFLSTAFPMGSMLLLWHWSLRRLKGIQVGDLDTVWDHVFLYLSCGFLIIQDGQDKALSFITERLKEVPLSRTQECFMGVQQGASFGGIKGVLWILALMNQTQAASRKKKKNVVLLHLLSSLHTHLLQSYERRHHLYNIKASGNTSFTRWTKSSHSPTAKFSVFVLSNFFP